MSLVGLVIFKPAVGGWSRAEGGSKIFRDLLKGGLNGHKFLLRGLEKFLS